MEHFLQMRVDLGGRYVEKFEGQLLLSHPLNSFLGEFCHTIFFTSPRLIAKLMLWIKYCVFRTYMVCVKELYCFSGPHSFGYNTTRWFVLKSSIAFQVLLDPILINLSSSSVQITAKSALVPTAFSTSKATRDAR